MDFVSTKEEIINNLLQFDKYLRDGTDKEKKFAYDLIYRGGNFVACKIDGEFKFSPSRYTGYLNNTKNKHDENDSKHGTKTTEEITKIIDHNKPLPNKKIESEYLAFIGKLDIKPFGKIRKYWMLDLQEVDFLNNSNPSEESDFEKEIAKSIKDSPILRKNRLNKASKIPEKIQITSIGFKRNPDVVAEVLLRAKGVCEKCNKNAPFIRKKDNTPYLEVHHKIMLSDGGKDSVKNAIAICTNCHRELHFGV
jgi:predicted HNH restriction endonuclease